MNAIFYCAYSFNQPLNNWNVSNVTYTDSILVKGGMNSMFSHAESFNQPLNKIFFLDIDLDGHHTRKSLNARNAFVGR